ncbi:hypothetical protein ASE78_06940 [Sphingomonas sp. Leaf25]|nr:hypothetical protein ASE78_06940 [Sphingomonas sp. Leaf25]
MMATALTTQELLRHPEALSFGPGKRVSSLSMWTDVVWRLDTDDPGLTASGIGLYWTTGLPDGWNPSLPDGGVGAVDAAIVDDFRKLLWIALADPRIRFVKKVTGAASIMTGITSLMRYMVDRGLSSFEQLTPVAADDYLRHLAEKFAGEENAAIQRGEADEDEASSHRKAKASLEGRIKTRIATLGFIWQARRQLAKAGIPVPALDPLGGRSASKVANYVVNVVEDAIPPIPDEVYLRIVNTAERVIAIHAPDVFEAQRLWFEHTGGLGSGHERNQAYEALRSLQFRTHGASKVAWPAALSESGLSNTGASNSPSLALHNLLSTLRDVCLLTVMATSGMRLSEVVSIRGGWTPGNAHPDCIVVERSQSGTLDLFFVRAKLLKKQTTPVDDLWLVGSRLAGTGEVPLAVRAIETLERLMSPWRGLSPDQQARTALSVCMNCPGMPWKPSSICRITRHRFATSVKQFYARFVDLTGLPDVGASLDGPDIRPYRESRCANVRAHQYRKNFAKFMLRLDGRLLPAIKRQYKHLRIATLQTGYMGRNPAMYFGGDDERRLVANRSLATMLGLEEAVGGRLEDVISRHERMLRSRRAISEDEVRVPTEDDEGKRLKARRHFPELDEKEELEIRTAVTRAALAAAADPRKRTAGSLTRFLSVGDGTAMAPDVSEELIETGATLTPGEHGSCGIALAPHRSRCNDMTGSATFLNSTPDQMIRSPSICGGCQLFLADQSHLGYWRRRYLTNERVWRSAKRRGLEDQYWVANRRAEQSRAMLRALGYERYDR